MRILDVTYNKAMTNAIIEVSSLGETKGNVELKIHRPSVHKKKGATIEMRKMSGFDYDHVLILRNIITSLLDLFIIGNDINQIIKSNKKVSSKKTVARVTSNPTLFTCDLCNWQTRFPSALKTHKTRIHSTGHIQAKQFKCDVCVFTANGKPALDVHKETMHNGCKRSKQERNVDSPTSSPPRKKENIDIDGKDDSVEMMDIEIDANGVVIKMLENRIKQLEKIKDDLEKEIAQLKLKPNGNAVKDTNRPPKHLSKVHAAHLSKLKGYSWRYIAEANGACATNSLAVAIHEDEDEGPKLKRRTLDHIADHYATYYVNKIGLPYVETVGVGVDSKVVTKETDEEMVAFLRSEEAMTVFANTHELLAVANMYNIRIHVFSYGGLKDGWSASRSSNGCTPWIGIMSMGS